MLKDADTLEKEIAAVAYGDKVEAFRDSGMVSITTLDYEGPDLSPGADRPNSMRNGAGSKGRGVKAKVYSPLYDSDGVKIDGRRVSPILFNLEEL